MPLFCVAGAGLVFETGVLLSHQRRDFVNAVQVADQGQGWADQWVS